MQDVVYYSKNRGSRVCRQFSSYWVERFLPFATPSCYLWLGLPNDAFNVTVREYEVLVTQTLAHGNVHHDVVWA